MKLILFPLFALCTASLFKGCAAQRQAMADVAVALDNGVGAAATGYAQGYAPIKRKIHRLS